MIAQLSHIAILSLFWGALALAVAAITNTFKGH